MIRWRLLTAITGQKASSTVYLPFTISNEATTIYYGECYARIHQTSDSRPTRRREINAGVVLNQTLLSQVITSQVGASTMSFSPSRQFLLHQSISMMKVREFTNQYTPELLNAHKRRSQKHRIYGILCADGCWDAYLSLSLSVAHLRVHSQGLTQASDCLCLWKLSDKARSAARPNHHVSTNMRALATHPKQVAIKENSPPKLMSSCLHIVDMVVWVPFFENRGGGCHKKACWWEGIGVSREDTGGGRGGDVGNSNQEFCSQSLTKLFFVV